MSAQVSTMREIDLTLARTLRRARELARAVKEDRIAVRAQPRTRIPGPNTYKRMSTGQLAMAALAGMALYDWSRQEQDFFATELENRGHTEALDTWRDETHDLPVDEHGLDTQRFDHLSRSLSVLTITSLENMAGAVDEVILGGDGRVPGALPPAEVIDDMQLTGADPDAIVAYEAGVGASALSPNELLEAQGDQLASPEAAVINLPQSTHEFTL